MADTCPDTGKAVSDAECQKCPQRLGLTSSEMPTKQEIEARRRHFAMLERQIRLKKSEYCRAWRVRKIAEGLCLQCCQNDALPGLTLCNDCRLWKNQRTSGWFEHSIKWSAKERKAGRGLGR